MKFLILGDIHVGKGINIGRSGSGKSLNSRIQDQIDLLNWALDTAKSNEVSAIFLTGDIYEEPRPHPALIHIFMSWIKKCEKSNIEVHAIAGNHDILRTGSYTISALDIIPAVDIPGVYVYKDVTTVHYPGASFTLLPFRDRRMYGVDTVDEALKKLAAEFQTQPGTIPPENKKILIGHAALEGSVNIGDEIDDMLNELFCPLNMFADYDYVWCGHIHKPQVLSTNPHIAHIGSMDRSDFHKSEIDHDKIIIIFDTESGPKEIIIPTRPLRKIEITVPPEKDTTDFIINELFRFDRENSVKNAIVKLEIQLTGADIPNADRNKIEKYIYEHLGAHHICNFSESRNIAVVQISDNGIFDTDMNASTAIVTYTDSLKDVDDDDKAAIKALALDCHNEYELTKKGGSVEAA